MKRILAGFLVAGLAATWVGCQPADDSSTTTDDESSEVKIEVPDDASADAGAASEYTLVKLKVPNMT